MEDESKLVRCSVCGTFAHLFLTGLRLATICRHPTWAFRVCSPEVQAAHRFGGTVAARELCDTIQEQAMDTLAEVYGAEVP